jgi:anti-sigma regulatory factor (Ser/Thr protein kinase)
MGAVLNQTYSFSRSYPAVPESVPRARRALVEFAWEAGADPQQTDALKLAASEAITNAVRHAYDGDPGEFQVTAALAGGELWVLISDDGHGLDVASMDPGLGMGLALIARVSDDFSLMRRASGGTELHMRFSLAARGARGRTQRRGSVISASSAASPRFSTTT